MTIPARWRRLRLSDVAEFLDHKRVPLEESQRATFAGPYPYYGASGVIDHVADYIFDEELLLLAEDGANILSRSFPIAFKISGKTWVNNHAHVLRPKDSSNLDFLVEYLESLTYETFNTGSTQPKLNRQVCERIPVLTPPIGEQKQIAKVAITWNSAIEKTERLIAAKERYIEALIEKLYARSHREGRLLPFGAFLVESSVAGASGRHARKLSIRLYGKGVVAKDEKRLGSEQTQYFVRRAGQLVYSKLDFLNGAFGIIPPELDGYESTLDLPAFDIAPTVDPTWLLGYLTRPSYYTRQVGLARGQRKARRIHPADFLASTLRIPSLDLQRQIANVLKAARGEIETMACLLEALKQQKRGLMQKLLTGQWCVKAPEEETT